MPFQILDIMVAGLAFLGAGLVMIFTFVGLYHMPDSEFWGTTVEPDSCPMTDVPCSYCLTNGYISYDSGRGPQLGYGSTWRRDS